MRLKRLSIINLLNKRNTMRNIFRITMMTVLCFYIQTPLSAEGLEKSSSFNDPFKENIGYSNNNANSQSLRTAPSGPGIGEDTVPISDGAFVLLLGSVVYGLYLKRQRTDNK
jgi:hypothetical protein